MEIRLTRSLETHALKNLGTIFRRVTSIQLKASRNSVPVAMFTVSCLPYEASRTYHTIMTEFECKRSRALVEAHRQNLRGF